ncbi:FtsK/SpoIIIE domain-containing protein [Enterococcus rivorum]
MLKTPDAAEITQAGRAYLQVGNNEIYELFQSAWSGADYAPDKEDQQIEDHTIYLVNELGQYELLTEDLSGLENAEEVKQIPTELDAIIDGIHDVAEQENIEPLPRPWLPPLAERIALSELHDVDFKEAWATEKQALKPVIGLVDIPSMQAQETLELNLTQEGHVAVFSSPGYGKSMFMQTVAMDLARVHNPERLNLYLLDFGTNGLLPLKRLPHVADTMSIDEEEKIVKFTRRITDELKRRKKLLSEYAVASLDMYERASGNEEPIIMILVDGYEGFKGSKFEEPLEKVIMQVAREGAGIGVHLLISAGRQNSLRMNLYSNIKTQIALKLIDDSEPRAIVGRTNLTIEDLPGRGLIKLDEPESFQTALPAEGEDTLQIIEAIQAEVKEMDEYWTGGRPEEIPMVPEVLYFDAFKKKKSVQNLLTQAILPLGVEFEMVQPIAIDFRNSGHLSVFGEGNNTFMPLKRSVLSSVELLTGTMQTMIIDTGKITDGINLNVNTYISKDENIKQIKPLLLQEIQNQETKELSPERVIYITDIERFIDLVELTEEELKNLLQIGEFNNIHLIVAGSHQYMARTRVGLPRLLKELIKTAVFSMRISDQEYIDKKYMAREEELEKFLRITA